MLCNSPLPVIPGESELGQAVIEGGSPSRGQFRESGASTSEAAVEVIVVVASSPLWQSPLVSGEARRCPHVVQSVSGDCTSERSLDHCSTSVLFFACCRGSPMPKVGSWGRGRAVGQPQAYLHPATIAGLGPVQTVGRLA
jgi:hypothetical protein